MLGRLDMVFRHPAEARALDFLLERGHVLLRHNYHVRYTEIDLITASASECLHMVEVKAWQNVQVMHPLESIGAKKRRRWLRAAEHFIQAAGKKNSEVESILRKSNLSPDLQNYYISFDLLQLSTNSGPEYFEAIF